MENRANYVMVGAFVVILTAALLAVIIWFSRVSGRDDATLYYIYFRGSVTGLQNGSTVRYRGVPIGNVRAIAIDSENIELIEVVVALDPRIPIKIDTRARLQAQGITGLSFIQLTGGTLDAAVLKPRDGKLRAVIPSDSSVLDQVMEQAPELLMELVDAARAARGILSDQNIAAVARILANVDSFTGALGRNADTLSQALADLGAGMKALGGATSSIEVLIQAITPQIGPLVETTSRTVSQIGSAAAAAEATLVGAGRAVDSVEGLAADLRATATRLANAADTALAAATAAVNGLAGDGRQTLADTRTTLAEARRMATTLADSAGQLSASADQTLAAIRTATTQLGSDATRLGGEAQQTLTAARDALTQLQADARRLTDGADQTMTAARDAVTQLRGDATRLTERTDSTLTQIRSAAAAAEPALAAAGRGAGAVESLATELRGTSARLAETTEAMMRSLTTTSDRLSGEGAATLEATRTTLSDASRLATALGEDAKRLTDSADRTLGAVNETVAQIRGDAQRIGAGVEKAVNAAGETITRLGSDAQGAIAAAERSLTDIRSAAASILRTAQAVERALSDTRGGGGFSRFASQGLGDLMLFLTDARSLIQNINRVLGQMERDPARFFFGNQSRGVEAR